MNGVNTSVQSPVAYNRRVKGNKIHVANVAELVAGNWTGYDRVFLECHTEEKDGGHGEFFIDYSDTTTVSDGGTVFVDAAGNRIKRKIDGAVSALWFGAGASGPVHSAFQAALDTGLDVYAPKKTYELSQTLIMRTSKQTIKMRGTFILTGASGTAALQVGEPDMGYNVDQPVVDIHTIECQDNTAGRDGIRLRYAVNGDITVRQIRNPRYGYHLRQETATARFIHNDVRGNVIYRAQVAWYEQDSPGGITPLDNEGNDVFINMITGSVIAGRITEPGVRGNGTNFICNFDAQNNYIVNRSTFGQTNTFICTDWADAKTATGGSSDGSTGVITGLSDTSEFVSGCYVAVSAGFPNSGIDQFGSTPRKVLSVDSPSQITIDTNSNSVVSGTVTVSRQNFFCDRDNVIGDGLFRLGWRPFRSSSFDLHHDGTVSGFFNFIRNGVLSSQIGHEGNADLLFRVGSDRRLQFSLLSGNGISFKKQLIYDAIKLQVLSVGNNNNVVANTDEITWAVQAGSGGSVLTGIQGGVRGRVLKITNIGNESLTIAHNSALSNEWNRIVNGTGAALVLPAYGTVVIFYEVNLLRWVVESVVN